MVPGGNTSPPRRQRALSLLMAGMSMTAVAREIGVSRQIVSVWNREAGVIVKPRGRASGKPAKGVVSSPITERTSQPTPDEIRRIREAAGLTQAQAASMILPSGRFQTWMEYELPPDHANHHAIPVAAWELFLLLVRQHPFWRVAKRMPRGEK